MKTLLRCGYIALVVLGVAIQVTRGQNSHATADTMTTVAASLQRMHIQTSGAASDNVLTGRVPSCPQPIHVMLLRVDGSEDEQVRDLSRGDEIVRYVYLGSVLESANRPTVITRWAWASVLFTVGVRSAKPAADLVVVALPRTCPELAKFEWAALSPAG